MSEQRLTLMSAMLGNEILTKHNVGEEQARAVADTVTSAERDSCSRTDCSEFRVTSLR